MKKFILATAVLLVGTLVLTAEPGYRAINTSTPSHVEGLRRHREIVRVIDVITLNPAYISSFTPDGYDSATQADLLVEVRRLSAMVASLQKPTVAVVQTPTGPVAVPVTPIVQPGAVLPNPPAVQGVKPAPPGPTLSGLAVLNLKCASCHMAGRLLPEQRFTLLDAKGNLALLTDSQKKKLLVRTYSQTMPPPLNSAGIPAVTDAEFGSLVELMAGP